MFKKPAIGYKRNFETWNVLIWATDDESTFKAMRELRPFTVESAKDFIMGLHPHGTPDMIDVNDMKLVDWNEVTEEFNKE
jgi:hypothetical protein